jgi:hypothetical protein
MKLKSEKKLKFNQEVDEIIGGEGEERLSEMPIKNCKQIYR